MVTTVPEALGCSMRDILVFQFGDSSRHISHSDGNDDIL
jgi:hypothetical protein